MLQWLLSRFSTPVQVQPAAAPAKERPSNSIRAKYDNAQTTSENRKLWSLADDLSANAANSASVRSVLRRRSRYEIANSSYLLGIVRTTANDLVGTGPTLQITDKSKQIRQRTELAFGQWSDAVGLTEKLRTAALAKRGDGEGVLVLSTYQGLNSPVKLYPRDVECDQLATPGGQLDQIGQVDGIILDEMGNPFAYHILREHPGDGTTWAQSRHYTVPARLVLHWFRKDRPGQVRGIPEVTPSLELFGEMRRYRRAVLSAAEFAASVAAYLKSDGIPNDGSDGADEDGDWDVMQIERGLLTQLPRGMDLKQISAEQPTTTFDMFQEKLLAEACRCLNVPLNVALGTSQKFNFSSARLDHLSYHASLKIERKQCEEVILNPLFREWLNEAVMIPDLLPDGIDIENLAFEWHWPGFPYMDPMTDAQADTERLTVNRTKTYRQHFAEQGKDWVDEFQQLAEEKLAMEKLGILPTEMQPPVPPATPTEPANAPQEEDAATAA